MVVTKLATYPADLCNIRVQKGTLDAISSGERFFKKYDG